MSDDINYHSKYLKYKKKYFDAKKLYLSKNLMGGGKRKSSNLPIEIIKNSDILIENEKEMIKDFQILFDKYDLKKYLFTKRIIIQPYESTFSHSHPTLTITRRYGTKKDHLNVLLTTFIHEQFHWWAEKNKKKIDKLIPILYNKFPDIRLEHPYGSGNKYGTYNHILVCFHEYNALIDLLGPKKAKEIIENIPGYFDIYQTVLNNFDEIKGMLKDYNLL